MVSYVWLGVAFSCLCVAVYGYVWLWVAMYCYVWLSIAMFGCVWLMTDPVLQERHVAVRERGTVPARNGPAGDTWPNMANGR